MPVEPDQPVTDLLRAAQAGDADAAEQLLAVVYEQLHQLARARMAHLPPGQTLQPTALVHEAYLRLTDKSDVTWKSRQHFFFTAARAMRDILVEQARRKTGPARGGSARSWMRPVPSSSRPRTTSWPFTKPWTSWKKRTL
jgi:RNA polymerase sigma factor (TIGR02999 family)